MVAVDEYLAAQQPVEHIACVHERPLADGQVPEDIDDVAVPTNLLLVLLAPMVYECVAGCESALVCNAGMEEMRVRSIELAHRISPRFPYRLAFCIYDYIGISSDFHRHREETVYMRVIAISED